MLRWVPLWQTMTSSGRLQIFVKTFTKEFQIFSFNPSAFFIIIIIIVIIIIIIINVYEFPLYHSLNIARSQHPVWSEVLRGSEILWEGGSGQQYANCKSIREAADIPCILPYPLDRYARSGAIHINRWPPNRELQKPLKWWHPPFHGRLKWNFYCCSKNSANSQLFLTSHWFSESHHCADGPKWTKTKNKNKKQIWMFFLNFSNSTNIVPCESWRLSIPKM